MAKNDVVLLDGIIEQRMTDGLPSHEQDEVFEYFVMEQMLKDYDLSQDEIESGWTDGRDDGGIDGFYVLINGHLLEDVNSFAWPRSNASIDVWIFTCKHHSTFLQAPLDSIVASVNELFNLSLEREELRGRYSEDIINARDLFHTAYRRLSIGRPIIRFNVIYGSRGDSKEIGESVAARSRQLKTIVSTLFSSCFIQFDFVGACELVESYRKSRTFSLNLPFLEHLATGKDSYVLLVRLEDYWKFVKDEKDHLRRYLFDSNIRDYLGTNQVNEDIANSLADATTPDFWWLNNGVTILATNATVPGKTIQLQDIQIVNGLQTTETIFRHFQGGASASRDRALLVKIIVSSDARARDQIIRATNNQSTVEIAALHATDKIQRDIEEILERHEWYYERRRNYYRNIGKPQMRFVTPLYVASAVVALIFKNPAEATRLRAKFMRNQGGYEAVFSEKLPIELWPVLVVIYKQVEMGLANISMQRTGGERFVSSWRALVSLLIVAKILRTFSYSIQQLLTINVDEITEDEVAEIWQLIEGLRTDRMGQRRLPKALVHRCCNTISAKYGLLGVDEIARRTITSASNHSLPDSKPLSPEFVASVDILLPSQPWRPGVHLNVASKLNCKAKMVSKAIQQLIADGTRYIQRDGAVYDRNGIVLAIDPHRVPRSNDSIKEGNAGE